MENQKMERNTYFLRKALDSGKRRFAYEKEMLQDSEKHFIYTSKDQKLLAFAMDNICMVSDSYILYAIAHLGVTNREGISLFLKALATKYPNLHMLYDEDKIEARIKALYKYGYLFEFKYHKDVAYPDKVSRDTIAMYTVSESGYYVVKQGLQKRLVINDGFQYKSLQELVGWMGAAYVGASITSRCKNFDDYLERVLRTKQIGVGYLSAEFKTVVGDNIFYIGVVPSYLYHDESMQTQRDYVASCAFKIDMIKNYICCRTPKYIPIVVVVVEGNADLVKLCNLIRDSEVLVPYLSQVYFTGEGIFREGERPLKDCFLQMRMEPSEELGYALEYAEAPFV